MERCTASREVGRGGVAMSKLYQTRTASVIVSITPINYYCYKKYTNSIYILIAFI